MISIYITCKDSREAKRIARSLLSKKLIACANMFPIGSMFKWKGKIIEQDEVAMLCKAMKKDFKAIEADVKKLHSYEVLCIVASECPFSNKEFSKWVENK